MKKIIWLLSLISMAFVFSLSASAAEERVVIDNVVYELMTDKYLYRFDNPYGQHYAVTDFLEDETLVETTTKITIVDEIDGIKVLGINTNEYAGYDGAAGYYEQQYPAVKKVILPETIKYMGEYAFSFFSSVEELILPAGLEFIMEGAFFDMESLKSITLPEKITVIPDRAFEWCGSLKKVVLQGNVTYIGDRAFLCCEKLTTFNFPETLKEIGEAAFYGVALKKIVLPADVSTFDSFSDCPKLKNVVYISDEPVDYIYLDDFARCNNLENIYLRAVATKGIRFGYYGVTLKQVRLQHVYFEGSKTLWNKLTTKKVRDELTANDIHTGFYYKHKHNYSVDGAPTCKKGGTFNCTCICGDSYKVTLPKDPNNHKFGAWKVTKEASCAVTGLKKRTCKNCGYVQQAKIRKEYLGVPESLLFKDRKATQMTLVWEEAENATGYRIYSHKTVTDKDGKKRSKYTQIATVTDGTRYVVKNLKPNKLYGFGVAAYNVDKNGKVTISDIRYNAAPTVDLPPTNLKVVSTESGVIEISLDSCGEDTEYHYFCGTDREPVEMGKLSDEQTKYYRSKKNNKTIKGLNSGETYYVMVSTKGENSESQKSEVISVVVK